MAPGNEVDSDRVVLFNFFKGHGQIKRSPIMVLNYNLIDYLRNSNLFNSCNPGQKVLGHLPFFMEFADNLQYTLSNTALTRFFPHPPWTKLRSLTVARYVKGVWLVTPNTVQGGGSTWNTFSSPTDKTSQIVKFALLYANEQRFWSYKFSEFGQMERSLKGRIHCSFMEEFNYKGFNFQMLNRILAASLTLPDWCLPHYKIVSRKQT